MDDPLLFSTYTLRHFYRFHTFHSNFYSSVKICYGVMQWWRNSSVKLIQKFTQTALKMMRTSPIFLADLTILWNVQMLYTQWGAMLLSWCHQYVCVYVTFWVQYNIPTLFCFTTHGRTSCDFGREPKSLSAWLGGQSGYDVDQDSPTGSAKR